MDARSGDRDSDKELFALQAALTEFVSQLNTECPDERPVVPWADKRTPPRDSSKFDNPAAVATPSTPSPTVLVPQQSGLINAAESFHSVRASRWSSTLLPWRPRLRRLVAACSSAISGSVVSSAQLLLRARRARRWPAALSAWPRRLPQIAAVFAIAIAGWMAIHIGSGLNVGGREQRAEDGAPAVQTRSAAPPTHTPHLPVQKPDARDVEARPRVRAPVVASPASRAVDPRPLPAPTAGPPLAAALVRHVGGPPVVPATSEQYHRLPNPAPLFRLDHVSRGSAPTHGSRSTSHCSVGDRH